MWALILADEYQAKFALEEITDTMMTPVAPADWKVLRKRLQLAERSRFALLQHSSQHLHMLTPLKMTT